MREGLADLLEKADNAIAASDRVVDRTDLTPIAETVRNVRIRSSYPDDLVVAALAGGTGSGKSSLFNAAGGSDLAVVGGVRPTTNEPVALATPERLAELSGYLDAIGVEKRVAGDLGPDLCLIDLPDTDSVEIDHRLFVESLLPRLDIVVWVVDPEKYRDSSLHDGHLKRLAAYSAQFVFVLNQADRLTDDARVAVLDDLAAALEEDGIWRPLVVATSANPPAGPPRGVAQLLAVLAATARAGAAEEKVMTDLEQAVVGLMAITGGTATRFEERLAEARGRGQVPELIESLASETGGLVGERLI
jgi:GTP-binding protein EngB required for normal cell division